jgi:hypothetical protein
MKGARQRVFPLLLGLLPVLAFADSLTLLFGFTLSTGPYVALWMALAGLAAWSAIPHGRWAPLAGAMAFALAGATLFVAPWGTAKRFYRTAYRLEPGMTRGEVARVLSSCAGQSDDIFLRSHENTERWYSDPWFAVCAVVYDGNDRLVQSSTFAFDHPWDEGGGVVRVLAR